MTSERAQYPGADGSKPDLMVDDFIVEMASPVFTHFESARTGQELVTIVSANWKKQGYISDSDIHFHRDGLVGAIYRSAKYLSSNNPIRNYASLIQEDPQLFLKTAAGSNLLWTIQDLAEERSKNFKRDTSSELDTVSDSFFDDTLSIYPIPHEFEGDGSFYGDSPFSSMVGYRATRILDLTYRQPTPRIYKTLFSESEVSTSGICELEDATLVIGTGKPVSDEARLRQVVLESAATTVHERQHALQPALLSVVAEIDAYAAEVEFMDSLADEFSKTENGPEVIRLFQALADESDLKIKNLITPMLDKSSRLLDRLTADHNVTLFDHLDGVPHLSNT